MLADRDYMREPVRSEPLRLTTKLIIANALCFVIFNIFGNIAENEGLKKLLYLSADGLKHGRIWQLLTFQFLHDGLLHLLFNGLGLYFFGRLVEERMPAKRFLQLYFLAGTLGGLAQVLAGWAFPPFDRAVLGASAGVSALIAAFSLMFWHQHFKVLLFFFIPVDMSGRFVFWAALASSVIGLGLASIAKTPGDSIAHWAHLGGFFTAFLFVAKDGYPPRLGQWIANRSTARRPKTLVNAGAVAKKPSPWSSAPVTVHEEELPPEEFISKEVDPILDKISAKGIHSLTERERKILEKARSKMSKR